MKKGCLVAFFLFAYWISGIVDPSTVLSSDWEAFKFPEVTGWKQSGQIQTFIPKTLFEYINGAADLYIMYDFQELKVEEYKNEKKASVIVEIYRHKTPNFAFGIYSQERFANTDFLDIGAQGYIEQNILNFLTGPYYVKINSFNTGAEDKEILLSFARKVAENLGRGGSLPSILLSFPEEGKRKNSEKFISKNVLGYAFLHSAFIADYELSGKKFKLFVIEGADENDCSDMVRKYLQQTKSPEKNVTEGRYTMADPYHGDIELHWKGRYIWGILSLNDPDLRLKYLKLFEEGLKKK